VDLVKKWLEGKDPALAPHLLLVGRSGSGKTSAAKAVLSSALRNGENVIALDWDGEYTDFPVPIYAPPFEVCAPPHLVADALGEVERNPEGGHVVTSLLLRALEGGNVNQALKTLTADRFEFREAAYARMRLEIVARYCNISMLYKENNDIEGVYDLSQISSVSHRAMVQQFLTALIVLSRLQANALIPLILVVEEGGMGARETFLKRLLASARKARVRLVFITHSLPEPDLRQHFELLLFDHDPAVHRILNVAIPFSALRPGECFWIRRNGTAKKLRIELNHKW
jgi:DNA polymerase III delta prime subunit